MQVGVGKAEGGGEKIAIPTSDHRVASGKEGRVWDRQAGAASVYREARDLQVALVYDGCRATRMSSDGLTRWSWSTTKRDRRMAASMRRLLPRQPRTVCPSRPAAHPLLAVRRGRRHRRAAIGEQCHSVSEGIGTLLVFNHLLASVAGVLAEPSPQTLRWGEEVARLEPAPGCD